DVPTLVVFTLGVATLVAGAAVASVRKNAAATATQQAAAPSTIQPTAGAKSSAPIASTAAPANSMPAPTPANAQPDQPARPSAASAASAHPEIPIITNALARPAMARNISQAGTDDVNAIASVAAATTARPDLAARAGGGLNANSSSAPTR